MKILKIVFINFVLFIDEIKSSEIWKSQARRMKSYMDLSVDPCDDFYQYACGKWSAVHSEVEYNDVLGQVESDINKIIKVILELELLSDEHTNSAITKTLIFYQSCLQSSIVEESEFLNGIYQPPSGWPIMNKNWNENNFDWIEAVANLRLYGLNVFIEESVLPSWDENTKNIAYIDIPLFISLKKEHYLDTSYDHLLSLYKNFILDQLQILNVDKGDAVNVVKDIVDFEINLAKIQPKLNCVKDELEELSVFYLAEYHPEIDWIKYFSIVFGKKIDSVDSVIIINRDYFKSLSSLISKTNKKIVANYLLFRIIAKFGENFKNFTNDECVNVVRNNMDIVLSALYIKHAYKNENTNHVSQLVENLKSTFSVMLDEADWLDEITKYFAQNKLSEMLLSVASTNKINKNFDQINEYYSGLSIEPNQFIQNFWDTIYAKIKKEQDKIWLTENRTTHHESQVVANAFYIKTKNLIAIPAGLLQQPIYHRSYPKSYKYGVLGSIIGHEITHGFDDKGRDYDSKGAIQNWWSKEIERFYDDRIQCMIDQYNDYNIFDKNKPPTGRSTLSENIADNGGLRQAFFAYLKELDGANEDIPEFEELNAWQLFFLSFAQFFCSKPDQGNAAIEGLSHVHTADRFRVIGVLSNFENFGLVYNCSANATMNPEVKCRVW